jgi:hypothetical protein
MGLSPNTKKRNLIKISNNIKGRKGGKKAIMKKKAEMGRG